MLNEADTRAKLIDPKLHTAGWKEENIQRDVYIRLSKVIDVNDKKTEKVNCKRSYGCKNFI